MRISLLTTKRFLPLFVSQFLGGFNDNIFKNALAILITYQLAAKFYLEPQTLVIVASGIFILPFFLFSVTAGELADKHEKSKLILWIKSIEIVLMVIAFYGFYTQNLYLLLFVLFGLGSHSTFFGPLKYAILPDHLHEEELIAGNGLIEAGTFFAILLGTILGSVLILYPKGEWIISTMLMSAALGGWIVSLFIPQSKNYNPQIKISMNIVKETWALIQYSKTQRNIFLCILGISWFWLFGSLLLFALPIFVKEILHANETVVTLFLTLFSIGLGIGSLLCNRILQEKVHAGFAPLAVMGMSLFLADLYFSTAHSFHNQTELMDLKNFLMHPSNWRISLDLLGIAICGGIYTVPLYALLQKLSEKSHRARIIASNNVLNALFMVGAALSAMLMTQIGLNIIQIFLILALANALVAIYICKLIPDFVIKGFFKILLTLLYRVEVKGLENYHQAGERVIIIANHTSFIDALLLAVFLPDKFIFAVNTFAAKTWWVKFFVRLVDAYPVDPSNPIALKSLIELVQKNKRCVIFPEGRLTVTGSLMKIYEGPGLIADKSAAKLLPIHIAGAQLTPFSRLRGKFRIHYFPKITLTIFPAQELRIPKELKGKIRRQRISYYLYEMMTNIIFSSSCYDHTLFYSLIEAQSKSNVRKIIEDIDRKPISYKQLLTRSFFLSNKITQDTQVGENVGVLLPNMISNVITFFALQAVGRVPAMLNYSSGIQNILYACQTAKIRVIYTAHKFIAVAKLDELIKQLKVAHIRIIYLEEVREKINVFSRLKAWLQAQCPRLAYRATFIRSKPEDPGVVLFTSGSEGTPKGVVLSHRNVQANCCQLRACIDFNAQDKVFNALPIFHSFGLTAGLLLPLLSGVRSFLYPSPLHYRLIPELSYDTNATIFFGTDTFLSSYAKYAHPYDFYSIRYVFSGAEKLREETRKLWVQKFGIRIFEGYGATETSPVIAMNTPLQNKPGTVGQILPGIQYQLQAIPGIAEGGVLSVLGPNVMKGYLLLSQPGELVSYEQKWYETGDIVSIDESGFVSILGRKKRFAKIAGEMVSLTMVEQMVNQLWPQNQHAVISVPDTKKGEQLILMTTRKEASREEFVAFAKESRCAEIAIPKKILFSLSIPLLGTGKIDYPAVKQMVMNLIPQMN